MDYLLECALANAVLAAGLAVVAAVVGRLSRRAHIVYGLWLLVLLKLITPPLVRIPLPFLSIAGGDKDNLAAPSPDRSPTASSNLRTAPIGAADARPLVQPETLAGVGVDFSLPLTPPANSNRLRQFPVSVIIPETAAPRAQAANDPRPADAPSWRPPGRLAAWLVGAWLIGSIFWFAAVGWRVVRFRRWLRRAAPAPEPLAAEVAALSRKFGIRRCPLVRIVTGPIPPLLWAQERRAVILLPRGLLDRLTPQQQATVLAHELAHLRRRDHWVRWLEAVAVGLYWWHPVAWWARRELHHAEEQCCDAWVLWTFPELACSYAQTLLDTIDFLDNVRPDCPAVASPFGQARLVKRRLEMILQRRLPRRMSWTARLGMLVCGLAFLPWSAVAVRGQDKAPPSAAEKAPLPDDTKQPPVDDKATPPADDKATPPVDEKVPPPPTDKELPAADYVKQPDAPDDVHQRLDRLEKMMEDVVKYLKSAPPKESAPTKESAPQKEQDWKHRDKYAEGKKSAAGEGDLQAQLNDTLLERTKVLTRLQDLTREFEKLTIWEQELKARAEQLEAQMVGKLRKNPSKFDPADMKGGEEKLEYKRKLERLFKKGYKNAPLDKSGESAKDAVEQPAKDKYPDELPLRKDPPDPRK